MAKKDRFQHEADTAPGKRSGEGRRTTKPSMGRPASGPAPKKKHSESAPTLPPPPPSSRGKAPTARPQSRTKPSPSTASIKRRRAPHESDIPGATVDEVVADLSRDPRREKD